MSSLNSCPHIHARLKPLKHHKSQHDYLFNATCHSIPINHAQKSCSWVKMHNRGFFARLIGSLASFSQDISEALLHIFVPFCRSLIVNCHWDPEIIRPPLSERARIMGTILKCNQAELLDSFYSRAFLFYRRTLSLSVFV